MKKDIEWLKKVIQKNKDFHSKSMFQNEDYSKGKAGAYRYTLELIDQLDEPEVLSHDWIEENKFEVNGWNEAVHVEDLQNLLVPKLELPVIPKYVGDWITKYRKVFDLYPALKKLEDSPLIWERIYTWYRTNTHEFVNAYLTGEYEVEEEPLYCVEDGKHTLLCKWESSDGWKVISTMEATEDGLHTDTLVFELTEQEIKDFDPRYFSFAKKVEEMEE